MLQIIEHASRNYADRTEHNASVADVTVAFAVDFETKGERKTKKVAGDRHLAVHLLTDSAIDAARRLYVKLKQSGGSRLNVAGNGIYTLAEHGWDQERANAYVYDVLAKVHEHWPLTLVVSGGQTGIDIAGAVAGTALSIDTVVTLPRGFLQRDVDMVDRTHTRDEIEAQVMAGAEPLIAKALTAALGSFAQPEPASNGM